jgi:benzoyl-CoA reductase subunit C
MPEVTFFEFLHTKFRTSALYNRDRVGKFKQTLERWSGKTIDEAALRDAIKVCNENRKLLQEIARWRIESPPRLSGTDALQIIGSSMFMPKRDHNILLHQLLSQKNTLTTRGGARLFVEGNSLDNLNLYELVESCGATIIAEDSDWGNRYFDTLVDETADPLDAIVDRYQFKAPSPTKSTVQERVDYLSRQIAATKPDGVLFYILAGEHPAMWDYPEQRNAIRAMGIPTLCFDHQPYQLTARDELKSQIASLVQSLVIKEPA